MAGLQASYRQSFLTLSVGPQAPHKPAATPTERRTTSLPVRVERRGVPVPEWIRRAREAKLPAKVYR